MFYQADNGVLVTDGSTNGPIVEGWIEENCLEREGGEVGIQTTYHPTEAASVSRSAVF